MSWRYGRNTRCPLSLVAIFKKSRFVLLNVTAESVIFSVFLENLKKRRPYLQFDSQKNTSSDIENLPQRLLEKFIGDNSSITDIA